MGMAAEVAMFQFSIGDALGIRSASSRRSSSGFNSLLEMQSLERRRTASRRAEFQFSIGDANFARMVNERLGREGFNSLLEMP